MTHSQNEPWTGWMFEAMRLTIDRDDLAVIALGDDANDCAKRMRLIQGCDGIRAFSDAGWPRPGEEWEAMMRPHHLCQNRTPVEEEEMTLLAAMAYCQEHELPYLIESGGAQYKPCGRHIMVYIPGDPGAWSKSTLALSDIRTWRIPSCRPQWVLLTRAEVEDLRNA